MYDYCRRQSAPSINDVAPAWMRGSSTCPGIRAECWRTVRKVVFSYLLDGHSISWYLLRYSHWPLFFLSFFYSLYAHDAHYPSNSARLGIIRHSRRRTQRRRHSVCVKPEGALRVNSDTVVLGGFWLMQRRPTFRLSVSSFITAVANR